MIAIPTTRRWSRTRGAMPSATCGCSASSRPPGCSSRCPSSSGSTPSAWFLLPILVYVAIPLADLKVGADGQNPPDEVMDKLEADPFYRWCTYLYIPLQYASLIVACYLWTANDLSWLGYDGGLGIAG